jgi:hypothetical protein
MKRVFQGAHKAAEICAFNKACSRKSYMRMQNSQTRGYEFPNSSKIFLRAQGFYRLRDH